MFLFDIELLVQIDDEKTKETTSREYEVDHYGNLIRENKGIYGPSAILVNFLMEFPERPEILIFTFTILKRLWNALPSYRPNLEGPLQSNLQNILRIFLIAGEQQVRVHDLNSVHQLLQQDLAQSIKLKLTAKYYEALKVYQFGQNFVNYLLKVAHKLAAAQSLLEKLKQSPQLAFYLDTQSLKLIEEANPSSPMSSSGVCIQATPYHRLNLQIGVPKQI